MIEKGQRLKKGDILRNDWAGDVNPQKYTMYIKRGEVDGQKTIVCLSYDGRLVHHCERDNRLSIVGHIAEYDEFIKALMKLKGQDAKGEPKC